MHRIEIALHGEGKSG